MKKCKNCLKLLPFNSFYVYNQSADGYMYDCKQCSRVKSKKWKQSNKEKVNSSVKRYGERLRAEVIKNYGGKCACCGESNDRFLTIDHIFNDGYKDMHSSGVRYHGKLIYAKLRKLGYPKDRYQLLCMNCNHGKQHNNGICPHKEDN